MMTLAQQLEDTRPESPARRYAVVPTRGDRIGTLWTCLDKLAAQVDHLILIDNSDDGCTAERLVDTGFKPSGGRATGWTTRTDPQQPPNLSQLWNHGLELAAGLAGGQDYKVAVLNDDAIVPAGWFDTIAAAMDLHGAAAGGYNGNFTVHRTPGQTSLMTRLPGHAFILSGPANLRADEQFQWWCGDNDLDMQARKAGGTVILPDDPVRHLYPDQSTVGVLREIANHDFNRFLAKWGHRPW